MSESATQARPRPMMNFHSMVRKYTLLLVFLILPALAWAGTPTFGTTTNCQNTGAASGCTNTYSIATTAGNIYFVVLASNSSAAISGVSASDNASGGSNTYTLAYSDTVASGNSMWVWYTKPTKTATTVSCNLTGSSVTYNCSVLSYTGLGTNGVGATITGLASASYGSGTGTHTISISATSGGRTNYIADDTNDVVLWFQSNGSSSDTFCGTLANCTGAAALRVNVTESGRNNHLVVLETNTTTASATVPLTVTDAGVGGLPYVSVLIEMRSTDASTAISAPTFSPPAGTYSGTQTVTVTSSTGGVTLCYSTNGTPPTADGAGTCTGGTTLSNGGTVSVASSLRLEAIGTHSGAYTDSTVTVCSVGCADYTINAPAGVTRKRVMVIQQ